MTIKLELKQLDEQHGHKTVRELVGTNDLDAAFALGQILGNTCSDQQLRYIIAGWLSRGSESALVNNFVAAYEFAAEEADSQGEHDHYVKLSLALANVASRLL